jgi:hypothetical protein
MLPRGEKKRRTPKTALHLPLALTVPGSKFARPIRAMDLLAKGEKTPKSASAITAVSSAKYVDFG